VDGLQHIILAYVLPTGEVGNRSAHAENLVVGTRGKPQLSQCLAEDVREYNIAVNILDPGAMKSEGSSVIPWAQHDWDQRVEPEIVGPSAVYLALRDAHSLTGQLVLRSEFGHTWGA